MVTIKMIAKECGFSIATVSKALNGAPDISAETKETIRKVASQMGYTPNSAARMLKPAARIILAFFLRIRPTGG